MLTVLKNKLFYLLTVISLYHLPLTAKAATTPLTLGQASNKVLEPVSVLADVMYKICYVLGSTLVLGSFIQYKAHRDNPSQVRLSQPIFLLIVGLVLIALPYLAQYSDAANATKL